jgi:SprT-like family
MVSYKGAELRVHRGYVDAPREVLEAIVQFIEARTRRSRLKASRALLAFRIDTPPARRRREAAHPSDAALSAELRQWHARLNAERFGGSLRAVDVRVSRRMRTRLGHYAAANQAGDPAEIVISRYHVKRHGLDEALRTLLHEMVHQWQDEQGMKLDHGTGFRAKARAVGIPPFARRLVAA